MYLLSFLSQELQTTEEQRLADKDEEIKRLQEDIERYRTIIANLQNSLEIAEMDVQVTTRAHARMHAHSPSHPPPTTYTHPRTHPLTLVCHCLGVIKVNKLTSLKPNGFRKARILYATSGFTGSKPQSDQCRCQLKVFCPRNMQIKYEHYIPCTDQKEKNCGRTYRRQTEVA